MCDPAWFHHRPLFDACEAETSLYDRFLALSHQYELVSPELLVIPSSNHKSNSSSSSESSDDEEDQPRHVELLTNSARPSEPKYTFAEEKEETAPPPAAEEGSENRESES